MKYALLYFETDDEIAKRTDPARADDYWAGWTAYMDMLARSGALQGGNALQPPDTRTLLRKTDGKRTVADGPFAETREELGGFVIVEADNLDSALDLAEGAPCAANGYVEVRPVLVPSQG